MIVREASGYSGYVVLVALVAIKQTQSQQAGAACAAWRRGIDMGCRRPYTRFGKSTISGLLYFGFREVNHATRESALGAEDSLHGPANHSFRGGSFVPNG